MALNIKDQEAHRMALELARRNGETVTMAVKVALMERLERQSVEPKRRSRSEILAEFSKRCAPLFKDGRSGNDLINDLYDEETGLPK